MVGYLAERTPLIQQLQLTHPDGPSPLPRKAHEEAVGKDFEGEDGKGSWVGKKGAQFCHLTDKKEWTPWDICDGTWMELK